MTVILINSEHNEPAAERKDAELQNGDGENEPAEKRNTEVKPYQR
jgi:hypothetical protein